MALEDAEIMTNVIYFIREKYFHRAIGFVNDGVKRYGNEPCLKLLTGICLIYEERYTEAIRELELLVDKSDVSIGAYLALSTAYKRSKKQSQQDFDAKVRELRKNVSELGYYFAGMTLFLFERYEKAREYLSRALKITTYPKETMILHAWVDIMSSKEANQKKAEKMFDDAHEREGGNHVDALLGKVKCLEVYGQQKQALEVVTKLIVSHPKFLPGYLEKMRLQLMFGSWDEAYDTASRCLIIDSGCIEALKYEILKVLCIEGQYESTSTRIGELLQALDRYEPKNAYQYNRCANLFARICGRNQFVLQQCVFLQERAVMLCPESTEYNNGMGSILLLQNKAKEAIKYFKTSIGLDDSNLKAIQGVIACQLSENMMKEAATQLEFLNEVQLNLEKSAELKYLTAVIKRKQNDNPSVILKCLDEAIQIHFSFLSSMQLSVCYIYQLNPDFLIQIVLEYFHFCNPVQSGSTKSGRVASASHNSSNGSSSNSNNFGVSVDNNTVLKRITQILEQIVRFLPGLQQAGFLLAKSYFMTGNLDKSRSLLETCLEADQAFSDGHILMAQIHMQCGNHKQADHALEVGLSYNFQVRENPLFHLMKGRILLRQGKHMEAKKTLLHAYNLPGVRMNDINFHQRPKSIPQGSLSNSDRLSIYLELAEALRLLGENHESAKIIQDAQTDFAGTEEEARIIICNADLAVQRGDIEGALTILRSVGFDHIYFSEARKTMADIYLKYRKDKKLYAMCFRELVERNRTPENLVLLGDAYMEIQMPDMAIKQYDEASKLKDGDLDLVAKMGLALIKTHNYAKAISYYRKVVKSGQTSLRKDLCNLLLHLDHYDDARATLMKGISDQVKATDYASLAEVVQMYLLLAEVCKRQNMPDQEIAQLKEAKSMQSKVLKKVVVESPDNAAEEKKLASEINLRLATCYTKVDNLADAVEVIEEARIHHDSDPELLLELARLKMRIGKYDSCKQDCMTLLNMEDNKVKIEDSEDNSISTEASSATLMMAELMLREKNNDNATFYLKKLLTNEPNQYQALALLMDILRRNGELDDAKMYFDRIKKKDPKEVASCGYNFCCGLYEWYMNNTAEALKAFNIARADEEWQNQATRNMIEICINPDNDTLGGDVLEQLDTSSPEVDATMSDDGRGSFYTNIKTAENLLKELPENEPQTLYLQHMIYAASKQKNLVEKAVSYFSDKVKQEPKSILYNYGAAVAFIMIRQTNRNKSHLNNIINEEWNREYGNELEKAWILMSDFHISNRNFSAAVELINKCIKYNKSCFKAYEYLGLISEKEQQYKEAGSNYKNAWIYSQKNNPAIGYKLAYNLLKSQKYVESVEVCLEVLKANPKYPKIRKEILDKARISIRV